MVTWVNELTGVVAMLKVALLAFAGTITLEGTLAAAGSLLVSETTSPPLGAGPSRLTVASDALPPTTVAGFSPSPVRLAGRTSRTADWVTPPSDAEIVTCWAAVIGDVDTTNEALDEPAGTLTLGGTAATAGSLLLSAIASPPLGAGPLSVTVASAVLPPTTVEELNVTAVGVAGLTSRVALLVTPRAAAEMITCAVLATGLVETVKFALEEPALTFTLAGTVTVATSLLVSVTTVPPDGAGPFSVTVACTGLPPMTAVVPSVTAVGVAALTVSVVLFETPA
jgi:hypothetical protein